jgi:hypothetical protein
MMKSQKCHHECHTQMPPAMEAHRNLVKSCEFDRDSTSLTRLFRFRRIAIRR